MNERNSRPTQRSPQRHRTAAPGAVVMAVGLAVLAGGAVRADGGSPIAVSPGSAERFAVAGTPCPTFSWSAVAGVAAYELVVYEAPVGAAVETTGKEPVLRARIPGGALAWTPAADACLEIAGAYAWAVRGVGADGGGEWSESRLFRVDPEAVLGELGPILRRAIERELRREVNDAGAGPLIAGAGRAGAAQTEALPPALEERPRFAGGRRLAAGEPLPRGVFTEDVELWLEENGSGPGDKVQLVFATPEFDGSPSDAWAIVVEAENSASADDGKMFFSTPSFFDALLLYTDGTTIVGTQREMSLQRRSSPPISCTSFLQEGMFYWDDDANTLCVCDGSSWEPIDSDTMANCV